MSSILDGVGFRMWMFLLPDIESVYFVEEASEKVFYMADGCRVLFCSCVE